MNRHILALGGTGMLGQPVVGRLLDRGHRVRVLTRSVAKTRARLGDPVELAEGTVERESDLRAAMSGCGEPEITLDEWFGRPKDTRHGMPH
ncbi:MAG: NAD-dependent epimerase/dehydratase family protein [Myxococcales bacterium FL481]|nr:MAG: NAD-dependent epimerase/dehydratase family protein [Myxococcales bacterium FL481]